MIRFLSLIALSLVATACGNSGSNAGDTRTRYEVALQNINSSALSITPPPGKYTAAQVVMISLKGEFPTKIDVINPEKLKPTACPGTAAAGVVERLCFNVSESTVIKYRIASSFYDSEKKENISVTGNLVRAEYTF